MNGDPLDARFPFRPGSAESVEADRDKPSRKLAKTFDPAHFEERWYRTWEEEGRFQPAGPPGSPRFVMVIPPPNVTGRLHIGHAFGRTLEDILARWKRMLGYRVLWVPGTDHAGIATQMVIERELAKEGIDKRDLGREKFVARVWAFNLFAKHPTQSPTLWPYSSLFRSPDPVARCRLHPIAMGGIYRVG